MACDSVVFEALEIIIWLGQTLPFGWVIAMVTVSFGTCCHGYYGIAVNLSFSMRRSCPLDS